MALRIAVQMDPLESVNINADSTFAMMLEAQRRGHSLVEYHPDALTYSNGAIRARVRPVTVQRDQANHAQVRSLLVLFEIDKIFPHGHPMERQG